VLIEVAESVERRDIKPRPGGGFSGGANGDANDQDSGGR